MELPYRLQGPTTGGAQLSATPGVCCVLAALLQVHSLGAPAWRDAQQGVVGLQPRLAAVVQDMADTNGGQCRCAGAQLASLLTYFSVAQRMQLTPCRKCGTCLCWKLTCIYAASCKAGGPDTPVMCLVEMGAKGESKILAADFETCWRAIILHARQLLVLMTG